MYHGLFIQNRKYWDHLCRVVDPTSKCDSLVSDGSHPRLFWRSLRKLILLLVQLYQLNFFLFQNEKSLCSICAMNGRVSIGMHSKVALAKTTSLWIWFLTLQCWEVDRRINVVCSVNAAEQCKGRINPLRSLVDWLYNLIIIYHSFHWKRERGDYPIYQQNWTHILAVLTFFPFLLCRYFYYKLGAHCVCFKMICKKSLKALFLRRWSLKKWHLPNGNMSNSQAPWATDSKFVLWLVNTPSWYIAETIISMKP